MLYLKLISTAFVLLSVVSCSNQKEEVQKKEEPAVKNSIPANFEEYYGAALDGDLEKIKFSESIIVENINRQNNEGQTFLMLASFNGHSELCEYLIKNGAHTEARDNSGRTALMYASTGPFASTVKLLLTNGANVNAVDHVEKWTSLMNAAAEGQMEVVKILLHFGADKNLEDIDGDTAESFARQNNHKDLSNFLKYYNN